MTTHLDSVARQGFRELLHAEWTKFRTVRGWVIGTLVAMVLLPGLGLFIAFNTHIACSGPTGDRCPAPVLGPDGEAVTDNFYFAHQPLTGDGTITARVTALSGIVTYPQDQPNTTAVSRVEPWTKAGLMVKQGTGQGSAYGAVMVTGAHGVRMQYDYTHDTAGGSGAVSAASPRWLRLVRHGGTLTGYESADGTRWRRVGSARPAGLGGTVQIGLFVASPPDVQIHHAAGGGGYAAHFTQATATFDRVQVHGAVPGRWTGTPVGGAGHTDWEKYHRAAGVRRSGGRFTVTGTGDIAPAAATAIDGLQIPLLGTFAALIAVIAVGASYGGVEYRGGLLRATLAAGPRRGRVLAAKTAVLGTVAFVAGLIAAALAVPLGRARLVADGGALDPLAAATELRAIVGTAVLLAATAILALAAATIVRRTAIAVTAVICTAVLPYVLAFATLVPDGVAAWLMRVSPAAGFAIQQVLVQYPQVTNDYAVTGGYFPLPSWAGLAVTCGYAIVAVAVATNRLRARDA